MKRFSFFLVLATLIVSFGLANAGQVYLDGVDGDWDDGGTAKLHPGLPVTFYIGVNNDDPVKHGGLSNGFAITSTIDGFTPMTLEELDASWSSTRFTLAQGQNVTDGDGNSPDIGGFIYAGWPADPGLASGDMAVPYAIHTGGFAEGAEVCLDSSFFPPNAWLWGDDSYTCNWDGPHCFLVETAPCLPPVVNNAPASINGSHCDLMTFDFDADDGSEGAGTFSANIGSIDPVTGEWSYQPTIGDVGASVTLTVTVSNQCDASVDVSINATNEAPVPSCPAELSVTQGNAFVFNTSASDDCDPLSWSVVSADAALTVNVIDASNGVFDVTADSEGEFLMTLEVTDGADAATCDITVKSSNFVLSIDCVGDPSGDVYQGQHVQVPVILTTGREIGGYDLLIAYDASALSFQSAEIGENYATINSESGNWEYFTYRFGANGNCSNACPTGLVRVTAIAETNNGSYHPNYFGDGVLFNLDFLVTNDRTFECQQIPLRFYWTKCADNGISDKTGEVLYIAGDVVDVPFDEQGGFSIYATDGDYPSYFGPQADCDEGFKTQTERVITLKNGCVFIACADSIDARGDLNLNNIANEIADAVLYSNYFVYGLGVFNPATVEGQIAASDVNADGLALSVADLVYQIRIIVGDAQAYPKLVAVSATVVDANGSLSVNADMGAAFVVYEGNVIPTTNTNMEIAYNYDDASNTTRTLIWSRAGNTFNGDFVSADANVISVELGSADGAVVNAKIIPGNYSLAQNYPNPFNPTTSIGFALPVAADINLAIYNITGQKVADFNGNYEAGEHVIEWDASNMASGVYFYKLDAGNFEATKKMVLMK